MPGLADVGLVGLGGAIGSIARYLVGVALVALLGPAFPWGTLAVNVFGSFAAGALVGTADARGLATSTRLFAMTGFLGGFTTFSAFAAETVRLAEQQSAVSAGANVITNLAVGLGAAVLGLVVARGY